MAEKPGLSKLFWRGLPIAILFGGLLWAGIICSIIKIWKLLGAI